MLYETKSKIKTKIFVINTKKEKDEEVGWERILELQIINIKKGTMFDINIEFQAQNETARLDDKAVRVSSRIFGEFYINNQMERIEILEKGGKNICPSEHYWLCSRNRKYLIEKDYLSIVIVLEIKAAMQNAKKTDYVEFGKCGWMQVEIRTK